MVKVGNMFAEFEITHLSLMKLAGDRLVQTLDVLEFELNPLEIKTFVATVQWLK